MRAPAILVIMAACGWSCAHAARQGAVGRCDVLQISGNTALTAFAADSAGGIALGGESTGSLRAGALAIAPSGGFVVRTNAAGDAVWIRPMGAARPLALALAPDGSAIVVGQALKQCFAVRLDRQGREIWSSVLAADGESACRAVAFDERSGDAWVAGEFAGSIGPARSAGSTDVFVLRLSGVNGEMRLVRAFGGKGADRASAVAVDSDDIVVAGTFGLDVDASVSEVNFGRGPVRANEGADGFILALSPDGATRWFSTVGEHGDDEVIALASRDSALYAAANLHRPRDGARCGGQAALLRNRDWVRLEDDECVAVRGLAFDDAARLWALENVGPTVRARAFAPTDGSALGTRTWAAERAAVRAIGIAAVPGGFAAAAVADGELEVCGRPIGNAGERTAFVVWVRDLAP